MIKGIYEAHLPVKNLDKSIKFYRNCEIRKEFYQSN